MGLVLNWKSFCNLHWIYCRVLAGQSASSLFNSLQDIYCFSTNFLDFVAEKPKLPEKKYYIDTNQIHLAKENMEIINPVKDGMSEYKKSIL